MKKKVLVAVAVLAIVALAAIVPFGPAQANSDVTISGTFSGEYYTRFTDIVCNPNITPVTFTGSVEVTGVQPNGAVLIGLVDKKWGDAGNTGWFGGAYAYLGRIGTNVRIGPSDGFYYGELNQVGANVPYVDDGPNRFDFTMVIYDGVITVTYEGVDYVDTYGEIENFNSYDAYDWSEFDFAAYVGIDSWPPENSVDYEITISGCLGPIVIDGCDTGVRDQVLDDDSTISEKIAECAAGAQNHGQFTSCIARLTNDLKRAGVITGQQEGAIESCAAQADIP